MSIYEDAVDCGLEYILEWTNTMILILEMVTNLSLSTPQKDEESYGYYNIKFVIYLLILSLNAKVAFWN